MDEQQLLQFYLNGGDVSTLSDADVLVLGKLMKAPQTSIGRDPQAITPEGPTSAPGLINPPGTAAPTPGNMDWASGIPGQEMIQNLLSALLKGGTLAAGLSVPGLAPRTLMTTLLGGAEGAVNPAEGESRLESAGKGALFQGGMEGVAGKLTDLIPKTGTNAAIRLGTPYSMRTGNRTREYVEAFLRQRQRLGFGKGVPVGKLQGSVEKNVLRKPPVRTRLNTNMEEIKAQFPERDLDFNSIRAQAPARNEEDYIGLSDPRGVRDRTLADEDKFWAGNEEAIRSKYRTPDFTIEGAFGAPPPVNAANTLLPPQRTLSGEVPYFRVGPGEPTQINFGDAVEIAQRQGKEAQPIFEKNARGEWVRQSDSPERLEAKSRKKLFQTAAEKHAESKPGGARVAARLRETNAAMADQYKIEQIDRLLRRGPAAAGIRAGIGAGVGGGSAYLGGGDLYETGTGSGVGGALGLLGYPANISRAGNLGGRIAQVTPSAVRIQDLTSLLLNDLFAPERSVSGTRRREPEK